MKVLHLAPHPDDEVLGAGAVLLALQGAGHQVINFAVSLGRKEDQARRLIEVQEACERMGIELITPASPYVISSGDDLEAGQKLLTEEIACLIRELGVELLISPSPHDGHHGHEVVGRAARGACMTTNLQDWWLWGLWADLPLPNVLHGFGQQELDRLQHALAAHAGEVARNDYSRLLAGRSLANSALAAERVWGYGAEGIESHYAEVACALQWYENQWHLAEPSTLNPASPLSRQNGPEIDWWIMQPSLSELKKKYFGAQA